MFDVFASSKQTRAIRKEFEEALEDGAWTLCWRIFDANPGILTAADRQRLLKRMFKK